MNYIKQKYNNPPVVITENGKHVYCKLNMLLLGVSGHYNCYFELQAWMIQTAHPSPLRML